MKSWWQYLRGGGGDRDRYRFFRGLSGLPPVSERWERAWGLVPWSASALIAIGELRWSAEHFYFVAALPPAALRFRRENGVPEFQNWEPWMVSGVRYVHAEVVWEIRRIDRSGRVWVVAPSGTAGEELTIDDFPAMNLKVLGG